MVCRGAPADPLERRVLYLAFTRPRLLDGQPSAGVVVVCVHGGIAAKETTVNIVRILAKTAMLALLGVAVSGCCVLPPYGWGHGPRGYGGHYEGGPQRGYHGSQDAPRPAPNWQGR